MKINGVQNLIIGKEKQNFKGNSTKISALPQFNSYQSMPLNISKAYAAPQINKAGIKPVNPSFLGNETKEERILYIKEISKDRKNQFNSDDIEYLAKLDDDDWETVQQRGLLNDIEGRKKQFDSHDIANLAMLDDDEWENVKQRSLLNDIEGRQEQFNTYYDIANLAMLNDDKWETVQQRGLLNDVKGRQEQFSGSDICYLANLHDDDWIKAQSIVYVEGKQYQFDSSEIWKLAMLNDAQWAKAQSIVYSKNQNRGLLKDDKLDIEDVIALNKLNDVEYQNMLSTFDNLKNTAFENPELYVNGELEDDDAYDEAIEQFFGNNKGNLQILSSAMDKGALNNLLRKRFDDFKEYLYIIGKFLPSDMKLLSDLSSSLSVDGKPFMPAQKVGMIDLIAGYKNNNLDMSKMQSMVNEGKVNLNTLQIDLFRGVMEKSGLTETEIAAIPEEKLTGWDVSYMHLLAKEINESEDAEVFSDLFRAANLDDFNRYIHDETNIYGQTNAVTEQQFKENSLNYEAWLKPSKENEVQFKAVDKNRAQLQQIANQLLEDIEALRSTPAKGFLDKQFPKLIKEDKFFIPQQALGSKVKLEEFIKNLNKQLDPVWKRAEGNASNPDPARAQAAKNTLTIYDHIKQRLDDVQKVQDIKATKTLDLTIKMWDRVPQKDINQGNYSSCCIGLGNVNGRAMPHYLMNTSYNMIEMVNNETGKVIGNALVFYVKDANGKPAFVVDNIEINNLFKPSDEVGINLRKSIVEYVQNINKEVTGNPNTHIYMGSNYNDLPYDDLPTSTQGVCFLGDVAADEIYMDLYSGWTEKKDFAKELEMVKLK